MDRRTALQHFTVIMGSTVLGTDRLWANAARVADWDDDAPAIGLFGKNEVKLLNEIAETILPATQTPGAKAAKVGQFIALMVSDCSEAADQQTVLEGIRKLQQDCKKRHGKTFLKLTPALRHDFIVELDAEMKAYQKAKKISDPQHFFKTLKDLTLFGYFTSEVGATQALRYQAVPGRYEGSVPYQKGDRAWGGF